MKAGKLSLALISALTFSISIGSVSASTKKTLNVGVILRLGDRYNESVNAIMNGIETAKALYEKNHPGVSINLKPYTHGDDLESVLAASQKATQDGIPAAIGGELSEESFIISDTLEAKKTVFITPTSSNPKVTEGKRYAFRACFSDRLVADNMAHFTLEHLNPTVVGVLHNVSSPYSDFLSKQYIETFNSIMKNRSAVTQIPIFEAKVIRDSIDFDAQIESFKKNKVTHVAIFTHQTDLLKFVLQAAKKGFFPIYIGSDGWGANDSVQKNLVTESPYAERFHAYRNSYWKEDTKTKIAQEFKTTFTNKFHKQPSAWNAIAFDAAWVLITAMDQAKDSNNSEEIRKAMHELKNIHLVTADSFTFGPDNSPRKDLYIYKIDKDGIKYEATLK